MPSGQYTPTAAVTALRKRAEAVAPGAFEDDVRLLFFLAREWHNAKGADDDGTLRDARREFGLQYRFTKARVLELENQLAERAQVVDWKAEMEAAVEAWH